MTRNALIPLALHAYCRTFNEVTNKSTMSETENIFSSPYCGSSSGENFNNAGESFQGIEPAPNSSVLTTHVDDLPPEVLVRIFAFLSSKDRKNFKLVCKLWDECSWYVSFKKGEKLVFRGSCASAVEIGELLYNTNRSKMNLEFQSIRIIHSSDDVDMWKACGSRIRTIRFHNCLLEIGTLKNIIVHCVNLVHIYFYESNLAGRSNSKALSKALDYFIKKGSTFGELREITLFSERDTLRTDVLEKLFLVFPRIKSLNIGSRSLKREPKRRNPASPKQKPKFDSPLESLSCAYSEYLFRPEEPIIPIWQLKLTKIEICLNDVHYTDQMKQPLFDFFSVQSCLKIVNLKIQGSKWTSSLKYLLFHVLKTCSRLLEFRFDAHSDVHLSENEVSYLLSLMSRLQCFTSTCMFHTDIVPEHPPASLELNVLALKNVLLDENLSIYILKHCTKVEHLRLSYPSDKILQEVWKTMPNLRTLVLDGVHNCTACGFTGLESIVWYGRTGVSINRLQKLEYLKISCFTESMILFEPEQVDEFKFPHLKHFSFRMRTSYTIPRMLPNLPELETLDVRCYDDAQAKEILEIDLGRFLRKLNYLSVTHVPVTDLKRQFKMCPSLKYVSNHATMYSRNTLTKTITPVDKANICFSDKENIFKGR